MRWRRVPTGYLIRLEKGEEAVASLTAFVSAQKIPCGIVQGIGALRDITLGYFDLRRKQYSRKKIKKVSEVVSLSGNISYLDGSPYLHTHIVIAGPDHHVLGGHFFSGIVAITLEVSILAISKKLNRAYDAEMGFNFWDL